MKTADDPRHKKRQKIVQELFKLNFHKQNTTKDSQKIISNLQIIDEKIQKAAPEFPLDKINRVDLSILRLAVYELAIEKTAPNNVIIDEAIELAKEFSGDTSPSFINGALGKIITNEHIT